uniref:Uncharacterized protein n=1 Tax=Arundo donax TaxID=35708 RepID=A0A0A9FBD9_ARUDO
MEGTKEEGGGVFRWLSYGIYQYQSRGEEKIWVRVRVWRWFFSAGGDGVSV